MHISMQDDVNASCYVNQVVCSQKHHCSVLQCSWILDCFLGMQCNSNPLCFRKSSTFFMQTEQLQITASDSHIVIDNEQIKQN